MAAENVQTFTDGNFDDDGAQGRRAGARGFLGGVVRPVQAARARRSTRWRPTTPAK